MRWRTIKQGKAPKHDAEKPVPYAPFRSRAMAFLTDMFMIGIPVSLLIMMTFGYDQVKSAGAMDVILHTEKATTQAPDPTASILQILLYMGVSVVMWRAAGDPGVRPRHRERTPARRSARARRADTGTGSRTD